MQQKSKRLKSRTALRLARETFRIEAAALEEVRRKITRSFLDAVEFILSCRGKIIILGMGKSGLVGQKIAGSLSSTGIPAFFVHPAEAAHGDLGTISRKDVLLAISYSGETEEVNRLLPLFVKMKAPIIALTGHSDSTLAKHAAVVLDIGVSKEADPLNMIPTSSTTATLAMGDALLVVLMKIRGFKPEDFARLHPGGSAGRMLMRVKEIMHKGKKIPLVNDTVSFKAALIEMTKKSLGTVFVTRRGKVVGVITDGDIRRIVQGRAGDPNLFFLPVRELMTRNPKCIRGDNRAYEAVALMEKYSITTLPVVDAKHFPVGIVHLHSLVQAGFDLNPQLMEAKGEIPVG